jgi:hypothetical protein
VLDSIERGHTYLPACKWLKNFYLDYQKDRMGSVLEALLDASVVRSENMWVCSLNKQAHVILDSLFESNQMTFFKNLLNPITFGIKTSEASENQQAKTFALMGENFTTHFLYLEEIEEKTHPKIMKLEMKEGTTGCKIVKEKPTATTTTSSVSSSSSSSSSTSPSSSTSSSSSSSSSSTIPTFILSNPSEPLRLSMDELRQSLLADPD